MLGLQQGGVMAIAKHFPGHGDTDTDSHKTLPKINHDRARLDSVELVPFKSLINEGIWGVMTAHIEAPALEESKIPASFSEKVLKNIIRNELNFSGLIFTDGINMQGAKTMGNPGEVDALALAAGNDIILFTENLPEAIKKVQEMIKSEKISQKEIEDKCKRSLCFKYYLLQQNIADTQIETLIEQLNSHEAQNLNKRLNEAAITLLINDNDVIPIKNDTKCGTIIVGSAPDLETIKQYPNIELFKLPSDDAKFEETLKSVENFENLIIVVADDKWTKNSANNQKKKKLLELAKNKNSILVFMGNVYNLTDWQIIEIFAGALVTYQKTPESQEAIVNALFGNSNISGRLPVSIGNLFKEGSGIDYIIKN
jgi:beta-glucosidase-like glycosyl hydrolase